MISGEPERVTIDDTYRRVLATRLPVLSSDAREVPHALGLVDAGRGWEDFIVTDVNRDLPRYAAERVSLGRPCVSSERIEMFRHAHHCAVIYGLIVDRVADGQRKSTRDLASLKRTFGDEWLGALKDATGSSRMAERLVGDALRDLVAGNRLERAALERAVAAPGSLTAVEYVRFTLRKLRWFGTSGDAVLLSSSESARHAEFRRAYDTFSVALQCIDDALDERTDEATRGASFPRALGLPGGGLLAAAPRLIASAARIAERSHFQRFARWLDHVARTLLHREVPGDPLGVGMSAALLCSAAKDVIHA